MLVENTPASFRQPSLEYPISVAGNGFTDPDGYINGGLYGPAHEEMAGVLDDPRASVGLLAGFGGQR